MDVTMILPYIEAVFEFPSQQEKETFAQCFKYEKYSKPQVGTPCLSLGLHGVRCRYNTTHPSGYCPKHRKKDK